MKKYLLVALAALALSGCDNAPANKIFTCMDSAKESMQFGFSVDMSAFPAYVTLSGKRLYPDETIAVNNMSNVTMYSFTKTKTDDSGYFTSDEIQMQKSNQKWTDIFNALRTGDFERAYNIYQTGFTFGTYSHVELNGLKTVVNNNISGYCEAN